MTLQVFSTPLDLATAISTWLKSRGTDPKTQSSSRKIPDAALITVCQTLYAASIATEEGEFVQVELVYIDPDEAHEQNADSSWQVFAFTERLLFTVPNLIKLAPASDPRNSAIAVFHEQNGAIVMWGLIDQRDPAYRVLRREVSSRTHEACGIFEASIEGPANIFVHSGHELIGELNVGNLRKAASYVDIFHSGPVSEFCEIGIGRIAARLSAEVGPDRMEQVVAQTRDGFISTLCTILLRLQTFRHGGALLLRSPQEDHLKIRYPINYNRLTKTLEQSALQRTLQAGLTGPTPSSGNYNLLGCEEVLDSAIWFVAVLSRVDGLVVMNEVLDVEGFGAIIRCQTIPPRDVVFRSQNAVVDVTALERLDYDHLGTRHQSMMRCCFEHPGAVGFVVSEDGDARAMSCVDGRLIVWENIKLLNVC